MYFFERLKEAVISHLDRHADLSSLQKLADNTAVIDSTSLPDAVAWPPLDGHLLAGVAATSNRLAVPAFPLGALPQLWRGWASDAAQRAGAPVDYVVQALLASVAAVSSRVVVIPTTGWQEPLGLWMAAVGASASGKSPALEMVQRLLWTLEDTPDLLSRTPPRRILLREDRFERIASTVRQDRRGRVLWRDDVMACLAPPVGARNVRAFEPYPISIIGTVHPAGVSLALRQDPDSAARFLYAWPQPRAFSALPGLDAPNTTLLQPFARLLRTLDTLVAPHGLLLDQGASRAFEAFRARLHDERQDVDGIEAAWLGKGAGAVARLAGVLAMMSWAASDASDVPDRVNLKAMESAVTLWWDYYRPHALALFSQSGMGEESQARRVVRWLRAEGRSVISREDIRRGALREAVDAREADDVIACLVEAGALRLRPRVPTGHAGRPAVRWDVNPLIAGSAPLRGVHGMSNKNEDAPLEWRAPSNEQAALSAAAEELPRANRGNRDNRQTH
jgi:hypothetical protein